MVLGVRCSSKQEHLPVLIPILQRTVLLYRHFEISIGAQLFPDWVFGLGLPGLSPAVIRFMI